MSMLFGKKNNNVVIKGIDPKILNQNEKDTSTNKTNQEYICKSGYPTDRKDLPEIRFRNIPWGSNSNEAIRLSAGLFSKCKVQNMNPSRPLESFPTYMDYSKNKIKSVLKQNNLGNLVISEPGRFDVSGERLESATMFFAYVPESGRLIDDGFHNSLYAAQYEFNLSLRSSVYKWISDSNNDTEKKTWNTEQEEEKKRFNHRVTSFFYNLQTVYGKCKTRRTGINRVFYHWFGKNDSELILEIHDKSKHNIETANDYYDFLNYEVLITYLWYKADKLLLEANKGTYFNPRSIEGL